MTYMRFVIYLNAGAVGWKSGPGVKKLCVKVLFFFFFFWKSGPEKKKSLKKWSSPPKIARNDLENAFLEKWPRKEKWP